MTASRSQTPPEGITQHIPFYRILAVVAAVLSVAGMVLVGLLPHYTLWAIALSLGLLAVAIGVALASELAKPVSVPMHPGLARPGLTERVFVHSASGQEVNPIALRNYTYQEIIVWTDRRGGLSIIALSLSCIGVVTGLYGTGYLF